MGKKYDLKELCKNVSNVCVLLLSQHHTPSDISALKTDVCDVVFVIGDLSSLFAYWL